MAGLLLVGPRSLAQTGINLLVAMELPPKVVRSFIDDGIERRDAQCKEASRVYGNRSTPPLSSLVSGQSYGSSKIVPALSIVDIDVTNPPSSDEPYKTVTSEIRDRVSSQNFLFALKFTLAGAIFWLLFSAFGRRAYDFQRFANDHRAGIFVMVALLSCVVVDTRLRFNDKVIESLGDWVWCYETQVAAGGEGVASGIIQWEHFLHLQLARGSFPVMRYLCHFLTPLLYGIALYLFVIRAQMIHRSTKALIIWCGALFFLLLLGVAATHGPIDNEYRLASLLVSLFLGLLGGLSLHSALERRFIYCSVFEHGKRLFLAKPYDYLTPPAGDSSFVKRALDNWILFGGLHQPQALLSTIEAADPAIQEELIDRVLKGPEKLPPGDSELRRTWENAWKPVADRIRGKAPIGKTEREAVEKTAKAFRRDKDQRYGADLAEDSLWSALLSLNDGPAMHGRRNNDKAQPQQSNQMILVERDFRTRGSPLRFG
jgi:hypothetical protein